MDSSESRLNQIPTLWTVVRRAHGDPGEAARAARGQLLERYLGAVRRYLGGALRDPDAADELAATFALRFLQGAMAGADPTRGRFRDFVKGVLFHLLADHHKQRARGPRQLAEDAPEPGAECALAAERDAAFTKSWREELLARAWQALERHEREEGQPYHTVLRFRAERPELPSQQMADELSVRLGKPLTAAGVRKTLERARDRFGDLLLDEIAAGVDEASRERLEDELADLGLLPQCRDALARRFPPGAAP